ncbi:MAG: manganese efflux pump [Ignavibacteriales bacterium]
MSLPSLLLLVLSCSLDNLVVGILYGTRGITVPFASNLLIAAITTGGTLICIVSGRLVAGFLTSNLSHSIGSLGIALTGAWVLIQESSAQHGSPAGVVSGAPTGARTGRALSYSNLTVSSLAVILEDPFIGEVTACGRLSPQEGCLLGLALSLNNFPNGFAAGVAGSSLVVMTLALVMLSVLTLWAGLHVGRRCLASRLKDAAGTVAGLILLITGIYELLA